MMMMVGVWDHLLADLTACYSAAGRQTNMPEMQNMVWIAQMQIWSPKICTKNAYITSSSAIYNKTFLLTNRTKKIIWKYFFSHNV